MKTAYTSFANLSIDEYNLLHQKMSNDIQIAKAQEWSVAYYGMLLLAGTIGIFSRFENIEDGYGLVKHGFLFITIPISLISILYILSNEVDACISRNHLKNIRECIPGFKKQNIFEYKKNYGKLIGSIWFWLPLILSIWLGWSCTFFYLLIRLGYCKLQMTLYYISAAIIMIIFSTLFVKSKSKEKIL